MIPFIKPYFDDDDVDAIRETMKSGWVAQGPKVEEFEQAAAKYLGSKYAVSTTNCTTALTLALKSAGIEAGDEVIYPDFTFPATAIAITNVGAKPVPVDADLMTYNVCLCSIERAATKNTKAIIVVHLFGLICKEIEEIARFAKERRIALIEDAACSLGAQLNGKFAGTFGDVGCFSLHASKGITTGEGGLLCTNHELVNTYLRTSSNFGNQRTFGRKPTDTNFFSPTAGNYKMSDLTAALALSQLKKIDRLTEWRIKIAKEWDEIFSTDPFLLDNIIIRPKIVEDKSHIYQSYVAVCLDGKRLEVMEYFKRKGFQTGIGTHSCTAHNEAFGDAIFGISQYLFENAISLPRYYGLSPLKEWRK